MITLVPIEQTTAVQEWIQKGLKKGREEGREEGELIGRIRMCQKFLKQPVQSQETLLALSLEQLRALAEQWEEQMS